MSNALIRSPSLNPRPGARVALLLTLLAAGCGGSPGAANQNNGNHGSNDAQVDAGPGPDARVDAGPGIDAQNNENQNQNVNVNVNQNVNPPGCGDGVLQAPEECDAGEGNSDVVADACRTDCRAARCGDTVVDSGEQCDDGGFAPDDGCSPGCALVTTSTLGAVPGVVVYWRPSPISRFWPAPDRIYTTSPSIAVLPGGEYLISFNLFGDSLEPPADTSGTTYVYRSSDGGLTWTNLTPAPLMDLKRGSLVAHDGAVYLWGYTAAPGPVVIRRSTDAGASWTTPVDGSTGLLTSGTSSGTPHHPAVHEGRLWTAVGGKRVMSVSTTQDFLDADRWAGPSSAASTNDGPLGPDVTLTEAQIVASPQDGVVVLPKVDGLPYTVLIRATGNAAVADPAEDDWVALPGGDKKFGAAWDPVSERYYVLSNPVLAAHANTPGLTPQLIRNAAAMLSSRDLRRWDVERIFLYSPNIDYEAFQYFGFDFDGDDLVIVSRTAFDIGGNKPPRGHDSNLITFHRIPGFRDAAPEHFLAVSGGRVMRHERTQHAPAPLGSFTLGTTFDGAPLGSVVALAQALDGDVYLEEQGGRILRFDALGNFVELVAAAPVPLLVAPVFVRPPARGERAWKRDGPGDWADLESWYYWGRPDTDEEVANLGSAITAPRTIAVERPYVLRGLRWRSEHAYTLAGGGSLVLGAATGDGSLEVQRGTHYLDVPVRLASDAGLRATAGATLHVGGDLDLGSRTLEVQGAGRLVLEGALAMNGGILVLDGLAPLAITAPAAIATDGALEFRPDPSLVLASGAVFQLLELPAALAGAFTEVILPELPPGMSWDTSQLHTQGTVTIVP
jgi:cysteine-rich repeat protein